MRSPTQFIVKPVGGKRYDNIKEIGGKDFIISSSQEDHRVTNRFGVVINTPIGYEGEIEKGDILLVHHNVFRIYYDIRGNEKSSPSFFMDDIFLIEFGQFFLYKKGDKWYAPEPYCFVKGIKKKQDVVHNNNIEQELIGELVYSNKELSALGVYKGDMISFKPESEYEFNIDGEKLYRMRTADICILV
tara:strand:- start:762 stop:1325 length:564 start_codon:yes stop_codon:yes gene_type:complete